MKKSIVRTTTTLNVILLIYLLFCFFPLNCFGVLTAQTFFQDDFEHGISKWQSITGLWHLTTNSSHSSSHSMWFGNEYTGNYDMGFVSGHLTSIPIDLSDAQNASLEFYHYKETEQDPSFDHTYVYITHDNIHWNLIYSEFLDISAWEKLVLNISTYCGNNSVQIRFFFDSKDAIANDYKGWLIDDVTIKGVVRSVPSISGYPIIGIFLVITIISLIMIKKSKKY